MKAQEEKDSEKQQNEHSFLLAHFVSFKDPILKTQQQKLK
jgi:hypothetical protein